MTQHWKHINKATFQIANVVVSVYTIHAHPYAYSFMVLFDLQSQVKEVDSKEIVKMVVKGKCVNFNMMSRYLGGQ